jgi:hypothetical protein
MRPSWAQDGKWIYLSSDRTGQRIIFRWPVEGGEPVQVTNGTDPIESLDGRTLYFTREAGQKLILMQRILASGEEQQVLSTVGVSQWAVLNGGVYYLAPRDGDYRHGFEVRFRKFATQTDEVVRRSELLPGLGLTVSPDRKTILVVASTTDGADLMLVENFR